jgi:hypothetical protein
MSSEPLSQLLSNRLSPPMLEAVLRARALAEGLGNRLRLAASRVGLEAGLALACALIDMIGDGVDPVDGYLGAAKTRSLDRSASRAEPPG